MLFPKLPIKGQILLLSNATEATTRRDEPQNAGYVMPIRRQQNLVFLADVYQSASRGGGPLAVRKMVQRIGIVVDEVVHGR